MDVAQPTMTCRLYKQSSEGIYIYTPENTFSKGKQHYPLQQHARTSASQMAYATFPPTYKMQVAVQEFHKLC